MRPQDKPKVHLLQGIEELVTDKGYHSGAVVQRVKSYEVRTYIPEKKQKGRRDWQGRRAEQQAVYENRRRVRGEYGKSLLRRRGELIERSFAHCYETGGMRRCHLRGRENILKRQLIHVGAFNLSLILRKLLGAGTPRELKNRAGQAISRLLCFMLCLITALSPARRFIAPVSQPLGSFFPLPHALSQVTTHKQFRHGLLGAHLGNAGPQLCSLPGDHQRVQPKKGSVSRHLGNPRSPMDGSRRLPVSSHKAESSFGHQQHSV